MSEIVVGILVGSESDRERMQDALDVLDKEGIGYEFDVRSAHRSPDGINAGGLALRAGPRHHTTPGRLPDSAVANCRGKVVRAPDSDSFQWRRIQSISPEGACC